MEAAARAFVVKGTKGQSKHILTARLLLSHMCKTFGISLENFIPEVIFEV